jgi:N6-adenosine-specific RNA methylase IME4
MKTLANRRAAPQLAAYDEACRAVAAAKTVDAVKGLRDKNEAMRIWARQAGNRELEVDCAEIRVRAERKLGELLIEAKKAGQVYRGKDRKVTDTAAPARVELQAVGIDKKLSMQAQRLAAVPPRIFESLVGQMRDELAERGRRVTLDLAGKLRKEERDQARRADYKSRKLLGCTRADLEKLAADGARFGVIYADPNWEYRTWSNKGSGRSASQHYDTAPDDDILSWGPLIKSLAADDCALLPWVTGPQLPLALELIKAADFEYVTFGFDWMKLNRGVDPAGPFTLADVFMGGGHYTRANGELCFLAKRGNPQRLNADVRSAILAPLGPHSEKPKIHDRIERLFAGPYLEMFARAPVKGWTVWGDEISREGFYAAAPAPPANPRARQQGQKEEAA